MAGLDPATHAVTSTLGERYEDVFSRMGIGMDRRVNPRVKPEGMARR
jgi:hypothetical protein